jgi:predicted nucleic acid-binding protein
LTLLDAYALIAFLTGGPAAAHVRDLLRAGDAGVASPNLAETLDVCARVHGLPIARAFGVLDPLFEASLTVVGFDQPRARRAAEVHARHYHRTICPISLADAALIASAAPSDRIATADPDVLSVSEREAIEILALPSA